MLQSGKIKQTFAHMSAFAVGISLGLFATAGLCLAQSTVSMKVGHDSGTDFPYHDAAEWFKKEVEEKTEGRVSVQLFPNAQLGDEAAMIDGLKIGSVDLVYTSIAPISELVPEVELFDMPFLLRDMDHALRVAKGDIGDSIKSKIEPATEAIVAGWGSLGTRDMWNSRQPIRTPEDLKGLKMRIQQSAVQRDTYTALGAQPTPISYGELYTSLQTGVVDGGDNGPLDVLADKFYQVTKYLSLTHHFIVLNPILVSKGFLEKVSPADREVILEAAGKSGAVLTDSTKRRTDAAIAQLAELGLTIIEIDDSARQKFIDAVRSVYDENADAIGGQELIEQALHQ